MTSNPATSRPSPSARYIYATGYLITNPAASNSFIVVDTVAGTYQQIDVDGPDDDTWYATSVEVSPDGDRVYVVVNDFNAQQGKVLVIDTADNTIVDEFDVGTQARYVAFSPDGSRALVTRVDDGIIVVDTGDLDGNDVVDTIETTGPLAYIRYTDDGSTAYVGHDSTPSISRIAGNTANPSTPSIAVEEITPPDATGVAVYEVTSDPNPDTDGDNITHTATAQHGTITDNNDGTFTYTPDDPAVDDTITFLANDSHGGITAATIDYEAPTTQALVSETAQRMALEPSAPANLNVIYPEPEDTNPLVPEQFLSNGGGPSDFDMNSLLSVEREVLAEPLHAVDLLGQRVRPDRRRTSTAS